VVPQITQEAGIELMRFYLTHLGLEMYSDDVLAKAYNRVDGHPYFLRSLVILSETYSLPAILESLPKFQQQIQNYIKEQVFSQLTESSRELITRLSVLRAPFTLDAIHSFDAISEVDRSFEMLLNKYLITKQSKWSLFFEIHDLVREYGLLQLSAEQLKGSHSLAAKYYQSLESKTYGDAIELIHHLLEADMQDSAAREAEHLISNALHSGLFNLVTSYTSHLLTDERAKSWSVIHFTRGRAFRLQGKVPEALKSYEAALACARDEHLMDASKSEIAGMLIRQGERSNKNYDIDRAKILYEELSQSRNIETQVAGLTSLGYLNVRGKKWNKGVGLLHRALKLAEEAHLQRSIMQIKIGLGIAYAKKDNLLATEYLEQASKIRREIRPQYGEQDIESEYYLFDALAGVYRSQKRFEDSVKASNECVSIDRQLNLEERLAHSLFQLGKDNCLLHRYASARDALQESLLIIKKLNLRGEPENAVLEWLVTALWNSRQYENAVEKLSEFIYLNQNVKGSPNKHVVVREIDLIDVSVPDFIMLHGNTFHLLVLPKLYDYDNLKEWNQRVVSRRPELAEVKLFYR
jgi:tetratricopeptide (TPR) repeat protein